MSGNSWLDVGGDTGIFKRNFCHCRLGALEPHLGEFCWELEEVCRIIVNFWRAGCLHSNKPKSSGCWFWCWAGSRSRNFWRNGCQSGTRQVVGMPWRRFAVLDVPGWCVWCCVSVNVSVLIAYRPKSDHELCALLRRKLEVVPF